MQLDSLLFDFLALLLFTILTYIVDYQDPYKSKFQMFAPGATCSLDYDVSVDIVHDDNLVNFAGLTFPHPVWASNAAHAPSCNGALPSGIPS